MDEHRDYMKPHDDQNPQYAEAAQEKFYHIDPLPISNLAQKIRAQLQKVIIGQEDTIQLLLVALLADGHVLLEGVPGIAKTLIARLVAKTLDADFSRIQFTPDLMPTDVLGTNIFDMKASEFRFKPGPIFSNIILVDEINRAPAKTQAALFEVMQEKQVSIDGTTYPMEDPFIVLATQNPIEQEGTYKLPEAQLDRFLFKIILQYPTKEEERRILERFQSSYLRDHTAGVESVCTKQEVLNARQIVSKVHIQQSLLDYIADIIHHTRHNGDLYLGASPRASLAILAASKAMAALHGRDYVTPDDIQYVAFPVLNHRVILNPDVELEGYETRDIIENILQEIEVPR